MVSYVSGHRLQAAQTVFAWPMYTCQLVRSAKHEATPASFIAQGLKIIRQQSSEPCLLSPSPWPAVRSTIIATPVEPACVLPACMVAVQPSLELSSLKPESKTVCRSRSRSRERSRRDDDHRGRDHTRYDNDRGRDQDHRKSRDSRNGHRSPSPPKVCGLPAVASCLCDTTLLSVLAGPPVRQLWVPTRLRTASSQKHAPCTSTLP